MQTESPLLWLPAELRLRIYAFAAGSYVIKARNTYSGRTRVNWVICHPQSEASSVDRGGLIQGICRQVQDESNDYLFKRGGRVRFDSTISLHTCMWKTPADYLDSIQELILTHSFLDEPYRPLLWRDMPGGIAANIMENMPNLKRIFLVPNHPRSHRDAHWEEMLLATGSQFQEDQFSGVALEKIPLQATKDSGYWLTGAMTFEPEPVRETKVKKVWE